MSEAAPEIGDPRLFDENGNPRRTILVVDDAPMFREIETVFLGRDARIVTASDGPEALDLARSLRPDLVLTDLSMRALDGDDLCRALRADPDLKRLPVVIVTSGRSAEEHERAVLAGANDVVEKPLSRVLLLQVVNRLMRLTVRGLERVPLETEVLFRRDGEERWGWSRNISRGGMFIETEDEPPEPGWELELAFEVPDRGIALYPSARVKWRRLAVGAQRPGFGLQFLKLDRSAAQWLDEYVYELMPPEAAGAPTTLSA